MILRILVVAVVAIALGLSGCQFLLSACVYGCDQQQAPRAASSPSSASIPRPAY